MDFIQTPSFFWISWVTTTVFGILIGWGLRALLRGNDLREEFEMREQERMHLAAMNNQLREANDLKDADLKRVSRETEDLREQARNFDSIKNRHVAEAQNLSEKLSAAQLDLAVQGAKIQTFEEQVLGLRTRNAYLTGEVNRLREEINAWKTLQMDFVASQKNNEALEEAIAQIEQERNFARHELDAALLENENLQNEIMRFRMAGLNGNGLESFNGNGLADVSGAKIGRVEDLKIINGVTPFAEQKLLELGTDSIAQIAIWDAETASAMNDELGFFPGRIEKENWVGQAQHLLRARAEKHELVDGH